MIPNAVDVVQVSNNIDSDGTGQFTVDENSLAKIMGVLTNLYADPEGAVVREYLTNALDAQIEAQENDPTFKWRPIEVSLPSHFSKAYTVRDFGIGMSVDDIKNIYSKYGKSTKESSNSVTGMLGLGSKCALTYTNQFTITGYKNGVVTKAIVTKDEADIPTFMIVDTRATTEPNGVEISVPVRDRNSFESKTRHFLSFWKDGQVTVNGREPQKISHKEVKPGVFLIDNENGYGSTQSYVVMGNVPYGVEYEYVDEGLRNAGMGYVAYVKMGAVDFPPSREKLMMTTRTKAVVEDISKGLWEEIVKEKVKEVEDAPDHKTAFELYNRIPHHISNHKIAQNLTYKGEKFPSRSWQGALQEKNMRLTWDYNGSGHLSNMSAISADYILTDVLIVTGVDQASKPTSYFKKKVRHYQNEQGISTKQALLVDKDFANVWFDHLPRVSADAIKKIKLPTNGPVGPRAEAPYDYLWVDPTTKKVTRDSKVKVDVPAGFTLAYMSPTGMRETYRKRGCSETDVLTRLGDKVVLVVIGKNRFEKFLRANPTAILASKVYQDRINSLVDSTTDSEFIVKTLDDNVRVYLSNVTPSDIQDPDLSALAAVVSATKSGKTKYEIAQEMHGFANRAEFNTRLPERKKGKTTVVDMSKRYPLLTTYHEGRSNKHLTYYVNAVFAAEHATKTP